MPTKSAAYKALRQNIKRRERNSVVKNALKKQIVLLRKAYTSKDLKQAEQLTKDLVRAYDKAAQKKVVHRNLAARRKSRLMARLKTARA